MNGVSNGAHRSTALPEDASSSQYGLRYAMPGHDTLSLCNDNANAPPHSARQRFPRLNGGHSSGNTACTFCWISGGKDSMALAHV
jgi:hypothetical protein